MEEIIQDIKIIRKESIKKLFSRYCLDESHANQVKKLSLKLFDITNGVIHDFPRSKRSLLKAAALLHDIGRSVSSEKHNIHSYDLILKNKPEGFDSNEIKILANITRYHRGKMPKITHENFARLKNKKEQNLVEKLGGILKLADGLDGLHKNLVMSLDCEYDDSSRILTINLYTSCDKIEVLHSGLPILLGKKNLFERAFNVQVVFKINVDTTSTSTEII